MPTPDAAAHQCAGDGSTRQQNGPDVPVFRWRRPSCRARSWCAQRRRPIMQECGRHLRIRHEFGRRDDSEHWRHRRYSGAFTTMPDEVDAPRTKPSDPGAARNRSLKLSLIRPARLKSGTTSQRASSSYSIEHRCKRPRYRATTFLSWRSRAMATADTPAAARRSTPVRSHRASAVHASTSCKEMNRTAAKPTVRAAKPIARR